MSVPPNAYRNFSIYKRKMDNTGVVQHLCAVLQVDRAYMLSTFWLDDLFYHNGHADGLLGVVGIIYPGTEAYKHHSPARHGALRKNVIGIGLNDCLRPYGDASQPVGIVKRTDGAAVWAAFKSSFYDISTNYGFEWNIISVTPQSGTINIGTLAAGSNEDDPESNYISVPFNPATTTAGDAVNVRAFITNPEGTYYSPYEFFYLVKFTATWRSPTTGPTDRPYQACLFNGGLEHDVFAASETIYEGLEVWNDDSMTETAPDGSYSYDGPSLGEFGAYTDYFYVVNGVVVTLKRCPEVVYLDLSTAAIGSGSAKTFRIYAEFDASPNTSQLITGVVNIVTTGPTNNPINFTIDVLANQDIQEFIVYDPVTGDPLTLMGVQQVYIVSAQLEKTYAETTEPYDREVVYFLNGF